MLYFIYLSAAVAVMWWLLATPPAKKQTHHGDPKIDGKLIRGAHVLSIVWWPIPLPGAALPASNGTSVSMRDRLGRACDQDNIVPIHNTGIAAIFENCP